MAVAVTLNLVNDDVLNTPITGAAIGVYDMSSVFITSGITDTSGNVGFSLLPQSYRIYVYKIGVSLVQPQVLVVTNNVTILFKLVVHERSLPESIDPELIRVSGYIKDSTSKAKKNFSLILHHEYTQLNGNIIVSGTPVTFYSDDNGYYEFDLYRNMTYLFPYLTERPLVDVRTPDRSSIKLTDLLFYVPMNLSFTTTTFNMSVGDSINIPYTLMYSDYSTDRGFCDHWAEVIYSTDNSNLVVAISQDKITINAVHSGTTHVTFSRQLKSFIKWKNSPPFISQSLTINVT